MDIRISNVGIDEEKCVGCGECKNFCPKGGIVWEIKYKAVWCMNGTENTEYCHSCTDCVLKCPQKAIYVSRNDGIDVKKGTILNSGYKYKLQSQ